MTRAEQIVQIAKRYIGQEEVLGNKGFKDAALEKKMRLAGWEHGFAWCALLTEIVWKEGYGGVWFNVLNKLFSASALATYYNFAHSKDFEVGQTPKLGAVVIWKHGIDPAQHTGHAGIVSAINAQTKNVEESFRSVEGNTGGENPDIREGYIVADKLHYLHQPPNPKGLNLVGFIYVNED